MTATDAAPAAFLYVTRLPPSPSGVALYASDFATVLSSLASTRVVSVPPKPADSQRLGEVISLTRRLAAAVRETPDAVVFVELAGRGLAEFWSALRLVSGRRRSRVWLTVHDAPEISGGAFFFAGLDRKGFRRIAALLSRSLGRRAESRLLNRSERVYCLAPSGAAELRTRFGSTLPVRSISHVVGAQTPRSGARHEIFLPGYLDGLDNIAPVLDALEQAPADWALTIGACSSATTLQVAREVAHRGLASRVRLLGFQSERELLAAYSGAGIAVRWRRSGWYDSGPGGGAVSGPLMHAMAAGCAVVTNDTRGASGCLSEARAVRLGSGAEGARELRDALLNLIGDDGLREELGASARRHVERDHTASAVAAQLEAS